MHDTGSVGPQVRISWGSVRGRTEDGLAVFRGMPYARPPVGERRLAAPVPAEPWDVRLASPEGNRLKPQFPRGSSSSPAPLGRMVQACQ
jgi:para-nitrobenzyl esterase